MEPTLLPLVSHTLSNDLLKGMSWRYACKKFDTIQKIPAARMHVLEEALRLSPSSYGLQPWKFHVISNTALKKELRPAAMGQAQVEDCSHLVVITARMEINEKDIDTLLQATAATRDLPMEALAGYKKAMLGDLVNGPRASWSGHWAARQCYIALANLMTNAALLDIDSCPMEGFKPPELDRILGLIGSGYTSVVCCALGYRAVDDSYAALAKVRYPVADVIERRD